MKKRLLSLLMACAVTVGMAPAALAANTADQTYTVTANLMLPGELNTQLPGVTAYMTNGNNPLGEGGYEAKAPTEPVSNNAKVVQHTEEVRTRPSRIPCATARLTPRRTARPPVRVVSLSLPLS